MGNCRIVWGLFGFDSDFVSSSEGNFSNLCSLEDVYGYMVSIAFFLLKSWLQEAGDYWCSQDLPCSPSHVPTSHTTCKYWEKTMYSVLKPGKQIKTLSTDLRLARLPVILFNTHLWLDKSPNAVFKIMLQKYKLVIFKNLIYVIKLSRISSRCWTNKEDNLELWHC